MQSLCCSIATLAVAGIYCTWRAYHIARLEHERTLRERVAYMLWIMASRAS